MNLEVAGRLGRRDRIARVVLGLVLLGFALFCPWAADLGIAVQVISAVLGSVLLWTAAVNSCPLYRALGICTR